ncbi:MAG: EAL domain-containing protein [Microcystaceae cyanobacterium]
MNTNLDTIPPTRYLLILKNQEGSIETIDTIKLDRDKYTIGRKHDSSITLNSQQASRRHATLIRQKNPDTNQYSYWIIDGDLEGHRSFNGIFINGDKRVAHELQDGDLINFGCKISASYHIVPSLQKDAKKRVDSPILPSELGADPESNSSDPNKRPTLVDTFPAQSSLDYLTGLPNQILFKEYLSIALSNTKRNNSILALLLFEIDQLEKINETYSYKVGEQILVHVGKLLKGCIRASDIVARWDGTNFVILLPQLKDLENGEDIQNRIINKLIEPLTIGNFTIPLSINTSLTIYPQHGPDLFSLIDALKDKYPITSKLNDSSNHDHPSDLLILEPTRQKEDAQEEPEITSERLTKVEQRLQAALQHKELSLVYQPQINVNTNTVEVMEALLRWKHPQRGFINPPRFFPLLEQTELILPITKWILETACIQNQQWQGLGINRPPVSINISTRQFKHPEFLPLIDQALATTGLDPHWLELEITEETVLENLEQSRQIMQELKQLGVSLSLDDFGQGLVSIGYLQDLPIRKLKIERSRIHELTVDPKNTGMISTIINLGETFKLQVVAEGVETQQQVEILRNLNCEAMQGYRFCKPLPMEEATQFIQSHLQLKPNTA